MSRSHTLVISFQDQVSDLFPILLPHHGQNGANRLLLVCRSLRIGWRGELCCKADRPIVREGGSHGPVPPTACVRPVDRLYLVSRANPARSVAPSTTCSYRYRRQSYRTIASA